MDNDIFSKMSAIFDNPETAEQVKQLAGGLMGGSQNKNSDIGFDPEKIKGLMSGMNVNNKNVALLNAIAPYMRQERAGKINSAIKAIQVLSILSSLK